MERKKCPQKEVAQRFGFTESQISQRLTIAGFSEGVQEKLYSCKETLSFSSLRELASAENESAQKAIISGIDRGELEPGSETIKKHIKKNKKKRGKGSGPKPPKKDRAIVPIVQIERALNSFENLIMNFAKKMNKDRIMAISKKLTEINKYLID